MAIQHDDSILNWPGQSPPTTISTQHTSTCHKHSNIENIRIHPSAQFTRYLPSHPGMKSVLHIFPAQTHT
uniref:Uncharacterized protein n=1 Tax=Arundo donax TaxID=35708 RepID=A0A0A9AS65_ARUDO